MHHAQRRCNACGLPIEARVPSCPGCGSKDLVLVSGSALAYLLARRQYMLARYTPIDEEPMVRCAFCGRRIAAAEAWHSRYDGMPVCQGCKQAEK
jgi:hypothetical protein